MKLDKPISTRDLSNGIVTNLDNKSAPKNCVKFGLNIRFDKILGRAQIREGTNLIGSQITDGKSILGLHQLILSSGTKYFLSVIDGASVSQIYRLESGTWTSAGSDGQMTKNVKHRFLTYLDTVMVLDGTLKKSSTDGTTWVSTGGNLDIGNCPAGKYVIEWRDRVYVAGVTGALDTLYYSGLSNGSTISWTSGNGNILIEPYEGQGTITGLAKVPGYLLIFKERSLKRWNGSSTFPDDLCKLGSPSQESIILGKNTVFYFSSGYKESVGIYETNGESTIKISRSIQAIIDLISDSYYSSVVGFSNGEFAMWSIGDITYDNITYSNVVIFFHIESKTWSVFSFPTQPQMFTPYIDSTTLKIAYGNNDGEIIEVFTGNTDNYTGHSNLPIQYLLQYHPQEYDLRGRLKQIYRIYPYTKNPDTCSMLAKIDEKDIFKPIGKVDDEFENEILCNLKFHVLELGFVGESKIANTEIIGYDISNASLIENIKQ